jgi:hypothetical protein
MTDVPHTPAGDTDPGAEVLRLSGELHTALGQHFANDPEAPAVYLALPPPGVQGVPGKSMEYSRFVHVERELPADGDGSAANYIVIDLKDYKGYDSVGDLITAPPSPHLDKDKAGTVQLATKGVKGWRIDQGQPAQRFTHFALDRNAWLTRSGTMTDTEPMDPYDIQNATDEVRRGRVFDYKSDLFSPKGNRIVPRRTAQGLWILTKRAFGDFN